jgi:hypothetical protein
MCVWVYIPSTGQRLPSFVEGRNCATSVTRCYSCVKAAAVTLYTACCNVKNYNLPTVCWCIQTLVTPKNAFVGVTRVLIYKALNAKYEICVVDLCVSWICVSRGFVCLVDLSVSWICVSRVVLINTAYLYLQHKWLVLVNGNARGENYFL